MLKTLLRAKRTRRALIRFLSLENSFSAPFPPSSPSLTGHITVCIHHAAPSPPQIKSDDHPPGCKACFPRCVHRERVVLSACPPSFPCPFIGTETLSDTTPSIFLLHWCKKCKTKKFYELTCVKEKKNWRSDPVCVWELLGVGAGGQGTAMEEGARSSALSCAGVPLSQGDHGGGGAGDRLLFWPGAFLSIFMECKRSFLFYFVFFVKLKQTKKSTSST